MQTKNKTLSTLNLGILSFASKILDYSSASSNDTDKVSSKNPLSPLKNIFEKVKDTLEHKKDLKKILILITVVFVVITAAAMLISGDDQNSNAGTSQNGSVLKSATINEEIFFPIRSSEGEDTGNSLSVKFTDAQRTEEILYKGKSLLPREGKDFIVVNLEINNTTQDRLTVRPVDFIRLVGQDNRNFAPDLQTEPIQVEPISIKKTRTIFIVDDKPNDLNFLVGDIGSDRQSVNLKI